MSVPLCAEQGCRLRTRHHTGRCAVHRTPVARVKRECVRLVPAEWDRMWQALERAKYHRLAHVLLEQRMERL